MLTALLFGTLATAMGFHAPAGAHVASRTNAPAMSHFSNIRTKLTSKEALTKSLTDLGHQVIVADSNEQLDVVGYKGQTMKAELKIAQKNGHDIGFAFNGNQYELVSDLQFWEQDVSVDRFINKVSVRYAVNSIISVSAKQNFELAEQVMQQDGTIKMTLSRWQ